LSIRIASLFHVPGITEREKRDRDGQGKIRFTRIGDMYSSDRPNINQQQRLTHFSLRRSALSQLEVSMKCRKRFREKASNKEGEPSVSEAEKAVFRDGQ
jgi:hypothetical protein